jgi:hypothetical protein
MIRYIEVYISIYLYKYRYIKYIDISLPSLVVTQTENEAVALRVEAKP